MESFNSNGKIEPISAKDAREVTGGNASGDYGKATTTTSSLTERSSPGTPARVRVHYFRSNPFIRGFYQPIIPPRPR